MSATLFSPSGGLIYHWRARKNLPLWQPFRQWVAAQFQEIPPGRRLCIFGASAGYTLPWNWINEFTDIIVVEPDPLARQLLKLKSPKNLTFRTDWQNLISSPQKKSISQIHDWNPDLVLFSNILGQIPFSPTRFLQTFSPFHWASYHDIVSCAHSLTDQIDYRIQLESPEPWTIDILLTLLREQGHWPEPFTQVIDHETLSLHDSEQKLRCTWWALTLSRYHLIAFREHRPHASDQIK